jgi:putative ABC transport system ATP-binding protein
MSDVLNVSGLYLVRPGVGDAPEYRLTVDTFRIGRGKRVGLIGESGSGKTSFLEVLGLLAWPDKLERFDFWPDAEQAIVNLLPAIENRQLNLLAKMRSRSIGFVLQDGGLLPYLSVRENANLSAHLSRAQTANDQIALLADALGLQPYLDQSQSDLSGGQKQRAAVLRALAAGVPLLLADEPTAALDPKTSDAVMEAMVLSCDAVGATQIIASHNAPLLERFGFEIYRVRVEEGGTWRHAFLEAA